jgi:CHAT domain-containing protein
LSYFENCLSLAEKENDNKTGLQILNNIGTIYADLEEYSNSIIQYKKGLEIAQQIGDKESTSAILNNLGIVYYNLGDYEESTRYCQMSIDLAQQIKSGTVLWEAFLDVGNAYKKRARLYEAKKSYQESIAVIENIRSNIEIEELKASYFGSHKRLESYYNLIDLLAQDYIKTRDRRAGAQAFEYLEKAKARAFLDSLEVAQVNISQGVNIRLANREKQIDRALTALYKKALVSDLPAEQREKIEADIKNNEDELEKLKREIRSTSPAYANLKYPKIMTLDEARKYMLDGQTAVLAFSVGKDVSYGFAIAKNSLSIYPLAPRKLLRERIADHLKIISDKDSRDFTTATSLFAELVEPAIGPGITRLIIIPDDALHYLPFETLRSKLDGRWLIEKYAVAYAPSLSSLWEIVKRADQRKEVRTKDLLAFGDPDYGRTDAPAMPASSLQDRLSPAGFPRLTYSGTEVRKISAFIDEDKKDIRVRDRASEQELKKLPLQKYKIIHFAAHGVIDDQNPARSAIVLSTANDDREDGFVQMREIYNLHLNADLVSLSACQTGQGQYVQGEGIEGLNRAFFFAGASAVMTSLWSINDQASAQLMERFYFHLKNHSNLMDALRAAKIELIRSGVLSHPYYWGAFLLTGDATRKPFNRPVFNGLSLVLALSLVMGLSIIWRVRSHGKRKSSP